MTARTTTTTPEAFFAIDVAKRSSEGLLELPDGKLRTISFQNNRSGIEQVISTLKRVGSLITVCFEPTGDYHRIIAHQFLSNGFRVVQVSSISVARYREVVFGTWDKNDRKDSHVILHLLKAGIVQCYHEPLESGAHSLRELSNIYRHISLMRTRVQHQFLTHFIPLYFPELERFWCTSRAMWMILMLKHFPTPAHILAVPPDNFVESCVKMAKRPASVKRSKFEEIYELARGTVGLPADELAVDALREHLSHLEDLELRRGRLEKKAGQVLKAFPDAETLQTLPGIGSIHALTILAEAGNLRRFSHHKQFLNYCGFNLSKVQSGTFQGKERLSKRGNASLRKTFWMAAVIAVRMRENSFREKYRRYILKDPQDPHLRRKALTAVAAKMARTAHSLVCNNQRYKPYFEYDLPGGMTSLSTVRGGVQAATS